jgi:hypothetical protein
VYADEELRAFLVGAKSEGRVSMLGTSCSYPEVVRAALAAGQLDDLEVVQLAAKNCIADPAIVSELVDAGKVTVSTRGPSERVG